MIHLFDIECSTTDCSINKFQIVRHLLFFQTKCFVFQFYIKLQLDIALSHIKLYFHVEIEYYTRMSHDRSIAHAHYFDQSNTNTVIVHFRVFRLFVFHLFTYLFYSYS